jgi:FkbM family methyltransferase
MYKKIKKFINAEKKEKKEQLIRFFTKTYFYFLPFFRISLFPFVSQKQKRNILMDFWERITNFGPVLRYRYYFDFKMFYSCLDEVGTGIVNNIMCNRIYEKDTCVFLEKSLTGIDHPTFIDVGANIGLISLYMLKKITDIKIYGFEPSPHQYSLFKKTIETNLISEKIELSDFALSDTAGQVSFFAHTTGCPADGFKDTGRGGKGKSIDVQTIPLDTWWIKKGKPKIDLIKVDTEGSELLIFKGAKELLTECKPDIFFEMQEVNYRVYGYTWKDVLSFFEKNSYSIYVEKGEKLEYNNANKLMAENYNFIAKHTAK